MREGEARRMFAAGLQRFQQAAGLPLPKKPCPKVQRSRPNTVSRNNAIGAKSGGMSLPFVREDAGKRGATNGPVAVVVAGSGQPAAPASTATAPQQRRNATLSHITPLAFR